MSRPVHHLRLISRLGRHLCLLAGFLALTAAAGAAEKTNQPLGDAVRLAPFVVKGQQLSISILARTPSDRRYAEEFAQEVVGVVYETLEKSTGRGLVIIGREGEPHPVVVLRKFLSMSAAGQLNSQLDGRVAELNAKMADWKAMMHLDESDPEEKGFKITFDMIMPALPLPLEGIASKLYQFSWAEDFDDARIERKLQSLTLADLESDALSKYDWVFYLPPRDAYVSVQNQVIKQAIKHEKMGLFKRAAIRSALVVFKPAIRAAVEGMRKGILFLTVLRARSDYNKDDIMALSSAYTNVLMPDFKFNGGSEQRRALEAIEKQKIKNAEYAKDPYVSPARLTTFDATAYAALEGEYVTEKKPEKAKRREKEKTKEKEMSVWTFKRQDKTYAWQYKDRKPLVLYPAGERLFVSADGKMSMQFKVDEQGAVTGVEERRVRHRQTFPRKG